MYWDRRRARVWQVVQNVVAIRHKGRELCYCLSKKCWEQPVGEFPVLLLGTFVTCLGLRIHWVRGSLSGSWALRAAHITEAVILCWVVLQHWGFLGRVGETTAPLVCWEIFSHFSWVTCAGVKQKKGCRTFLPRCIESGPVWQSAPRKCSAVLPDLGDKLRL